MKEKRSTKILIAVGVVVNLALIILIASFIFGNSSHRFKGTYKSETFDGSEVECTLNVEKDGTGTIELDTWIGAVTVSFEYDFVGKKNDCLYYTIITNGVDVDGLFSVLENEIPKDDFGKNASSMIVHKGGIIEICGMTFERAK